MVRPRWYDLPVVWFAIHVAELSMFGFAFTALIPDTWPVAVVASIGIAGVVSISFGNYRVIRWLRRRERAA